MEPIAAVTGDRQAKFVFPQPTELAPPIFELKSASVGYEKNNPILRNLDVRLDMDDRIALLGANGNGKTTFLRLIAGELKEMSGRASRHGKLDVGYFAQDQFDLIDPTVTAFQHLAEKMPGVSDSKVRGHLGRFGLEQEKANTKTSNLSGGEKARLVLATITTQTPHLLLLDEPTNHLDIDARGALVQALNDFEGAVILVSHDPNLVSLVADRLWIIKDHTCTPFDGDVSDYRKQILDDGRQARRQERLGTTSGASRREDRRKRAELRSAKAKLQNAVKNAEKEMERISTERDRLSAKLSDPQIYEGPTADFAKLAKRKAELDNRLATAESNWIEVQEALGIKGFGFDMLVACSAATFALQRAYDMVVAGTANCVLVINPELTSPQNNFRDRDSHFIFGDVATATIIENAETCVARHSYDILQTHAETIYSNNF